MSSQMFAVLTASEAIGSESDETTRQPRRNLILHRLHVIGSSDYRAFSTFEELLYIRRLCRFRRVQPIPTVNLQRFTPEFVVTGHAPDVRRDIVFLGENLLRLDRLGEDRSAAEQLD